MGINDFFDPIVPEAVEDVAGGLVHGAQAVGSTLGNIAQGAAWVANPTHWDDIGRGVGAVGSFIAEHPGQTWDMGFEVGRHLIKEEILNPKQAALNAAMIGASFFTGGASGAAVAAKVTSGALKAARAVDEVVTGARITRAALGAGRAIKDVEAFGTAARAANKAVGALGYVPEKIREGRAAIGLSEYGLRGRLAERVASTGAIESGEVGLMRGAMADVVRGAATRPGAIAASTSGPRSFADVNYAVSRSQMYGSVPGAAQRTSRFGEELYQAKKDPLKYGMEHGGREVLGKGKGYAARKATKNMFSNEDQGDTSAPTYLSPDAVYSPPSDVPDIGMGRGYGGGGFAAPDAPEVSESTYTSSLAPVAYGRGRSFYEGAGMYTPEEGSYA